MVFPGFVFSRKGFVVSRTTNRDAAYVLRTVDDGRSGQKLTIDIYKKLTGDLDYTFFKTFIPVLPYRIIVRDVDFPVLTNTSIDIPTFNPGLTHNQVTGKIEGLPDLTNDFYQFAELNVTRNIAPKFERTRVGQKIGGIELTYTSPKFTLHDTNASICVNPENDETDKIILSVVTQIQMRTSDISETYRIPLILVFSIRLDKDYVKETTYLPDAWTYSDIIPDGIFEKSRYYYGQINRINTDPETDLWNYNVIAGKDFSRGGATFFSPGSMGVLIDTATDGTDALVTCATTFNENSIWNTKIDCCSISDIFIKTGYFGISYKRKGIPITSECVPTMVNSVFKNNIYLSCISIKAGNLTSSENDVFSYLIAMADDFSTNSYIKITGAKSLSADMHSDRFLLGLLDGDVFKAYLTVIASSLIATLAAVVSGDLSVNIAQLESTCSFSRVGDDKPGFATQINNAGFDGNSTENSTGLSRNYNNVIYVVGVNNTNSLFIFNNKNGLRLSSLTEGVDHFDSVSTQTINSNANETPDLYTVLTCTNGLDIYSIKDYKNSKVTIGTSASFAYSSTNITDDSLELLLEIPGCTGIFALNSVWSDDKNGILIDTQKTRQDFRFAYNGNKADYTGGTGLGDYGYWADLIEPEVEIKLIYEDEPISCTFKSLSFAKYDTDGSCVIQIGLTLDNPPDDISNTNYKEEGYSLSPITVELTIKSIDQIFKSIENVEFTPPPHSTSITMPTKTISRSISPTATKSNILSKVPQVTLNQIHYDSSKDEISPKITRITGAEDLFDQGLLTSEAFSIDLDSCSKGDYAFVKWNEKLNDRPFLDFKTAIVSYVGGHRYTIGGTPKIYLDGVDKTDAIFNSKEGYVDINPDGNVIIKVSGFNINHENFSEHDRDEDNVPTDSNRYPLIDKLYLMIVPKQIWPIFYGTSVYLENPPVGAPITYPNGTSAFYSRLDELAGANKTDQTINAIEITNGSIQKTITTAKDYQIFLVVKDEFSQYSIYHITSNLTENNQKTYRTKFNAGVFTWPTF